MIYTNFKNFFKNFLFSLINFAMILVGIALASTFFLLICAKILQLQNHDFLIVMKDYLNATLANTNFVDIFNLHFLKQVFLDMINIGEKYDVNLNLYFFLISAVSVTIVFATYKGSIALVDYLHKRKFRNKYTKRGFASLIPKAIVGIISSLLVTFILFITGGNAATTYFVYLLIDSIHLLFNTYFVYFSGIKFIKFITDKNTLKVIGLYFFSQSLFIVIALFVWNRVAIVSILVILPLLAYSTTNVRYTITESFRNNIHVTKSNKKEIKEMKN